MKIAVLVTEFLKDYTEQIIKDLNFDFETETFIYYNYSHITDLYRQLEARFDGFITTGPAPARTIKKSIPGCKPVSFFSCTVSNYYKAFFEMIYKYQDWNFEYGYFDFCDYLCPDQESSLIPYLKNGTFQQWLDTNNEYMAGLSVEEMQESAKKKLAKHIELWKNKKIKYSLSRMSPIMPEILKAGVDCRFISYSEEDVKTCLTRLVQDILVDRLRDSQPAAIDLALSAPEQTDAAAWEAFQDRYELLERILSAFNKKYMCDFIIRDTRYGFRIATNVKTVETITEGFTACHLRPYVKESTGLDIAIGYGLGVDLAQAENNAIDAGRESRINASRESYLIRENRDLLGLFGKGSTLDISGSITPYMREIADKTGLSTLTVQKLLSALKVTGTEEVTTQELSRILHITIRSVNRIITALSKCNLARPLYSRQTNTKGRPSIVYRILLEIE